MKEISKKSFIARYNRIMLITILIVMIIAAVLVYVQILTELKHENNRLVEQFRNKSIAVDNLVGSIKEHLNVLQTTAEAYFIEDKYDVSQNIFYDALSAMDEADTFYTLDKALEFPASIASGTGNLTGRGSLISLPKPVKQDIEMALSLNSIFKATKENIKYTAWVYYLSKNNFVNAYPWIPSKNQKFSIDLYNAEFYKKGLPDSNKNRRIFWTSVYKDPYGLGMMVTAGKPVYRDTEFLGTVAIDLTIDTLSRFLKQFKDSHGDIAIVNNRMELLALSSNSISIDTNTVLFKSILPKKITSHVNNLLTMNDLEIRTIESFLCIKYSMMSAPWKIVYYSCKYNEVLRIISKVKGIFCALFIALTLMLLITNKMVFREFIHPAEKMVQHISKESRNEPIEKHEVPTPWMPWFSAITKTFTENRTLIQEIKEKNEKLVERNCSIERYMPKFILLLNVKDKSGATSIGNFITHSFCKSSGTVKKTIYTEYPYPEKIADTFSSDPSSTIFKHPNGYDIYIPNNLKDIPEKAKASLLMSKLLDNYHNIVMNVSIRNAFDENLELILKYAKMIIVVIPPDFSQGAEYDSILKELKKRVHPGSTALYTLVNHTNGSGIHCSTSNQFDFTIPYSGMFPRISDNKYNIPETIQMTIDGMVERVECIHTISLFIPTTIQVNHVIAVDEYVTDALKFMAEKFGGATCNKANGVWNSNQIGLVNEVVYILMSYTSEYKLNKYANEVIDYMRQMKIKLAQEAMAIEINKKMILI